jgi:hypothetical protein
MVKKKRCSRLEKMFRAGQLHPTKHTMHLPKLGEQGRRIYEIISRICIFYEKVISQFQL